MPVSGKVIDGGTLAPWSTRLSTAGSRLAALQRILSASWPGLLAFAALLLVNSGSSANLVAVSALTSPKLGDRRLKPGDEVITVAAGFPTTVNPILQNRLVPVFVDVTLPTYEIDVTQLEAASQRQNQGRDDRAHAGQCLRSRRRHATLCEKHDLWLD